MSRALPPNPSLEALQKEARQLQRAQAQGDPASCSTLRLLHQFGGRSDKEILATRLKLTDAQFALALDYGFRSWADLRDTVTWSDPRITERVDGGYRHRYDLGRIAPRMRDQRFFPHSSLTTEQHFRNQFHNELHALEALRDCDCAPAVVDADASSLTMTVEDVGDVGLPEDGAGSLETALRRSSRRLAKPKEISADWRQWQIERAVGCLEELRRI